MPSYVAVLRRLASLALAGSVCLYGPAADAQTTGAAAGAQGRITPSPSGVRVVRPAPGTGAIRSRVTSIQGGAWRADNSPIPQALLRLRNVVTGRIDATAVANEAGQFAFSNIPDGTYLVEMVTESGRVLSVGHTFTVAPGETVATFVRLGTKVPWFNGFFGNAALAVASSAAAAGVLALSPETVTSVSPNR